MLVPRLSSGDPRERHRGLSHHTGPCCSCCCAPCGCRCPSGLSLPSSAALGRAIAHGGHEGVGVDVTELVEAYLASGLPAGTMGRSFEEDRDFFLAALAGGALLAEMISEKER